MKEDNEGIYTIRLTREQGLLALKMLDIEIRELQDRLDNAIILRATIGGQMNTDDEE